MKWNGRKAFLILAVFSCSFLNSQQNVYAEEKLQEFVLDPMVVTAQGFATKDLETPALVEVFNEKEIEDSGANNAYDVLQDTLGVTASSYGFNGTNQGTMTSKIMVRGVQDGTLVLVDGIPMNMDGRYNLDDIPSDAIERIEVVKGGGSVLYGSEATGGVINIITKKQLRNKIKVATGNYGKERYDITIGAGKFNLLAGLENRGEAKNLKGLGYNKAPEAESVYDYGKGERQSIRWNYLLSEGLTFTHSYSENENRYLKRKYLGSTYNQMNDYKNTDNSFLLDYDKDGWKAYISYGTQEKDNDQTNIKSGVRELINNYNWRKGHNTNMKLQKQFDIGNDKLLVGVSYQKEDMDTYSVKKSSTNEVDSNMRRDNYSVFLSYDMAVNEKSNFIVNMRETWVTNNEGRQIDLTENKKTVTKNDDLSKFTPEAEYIYRINEDSSVYAKAGKSFKLPTMTQIYGSGALHPALNLKPEEGTHYEIGYKINAEKSAWRLAIFNYEVKDSVEAVKNEDESQGYDYFNKDIRNTGVELSVTLAHDNKWTSRWGITYHNPQVRDDNPDGYADNAWHDYGSRYQFNSSLSYVDAKFSSTLKANFVGDRTSDTKEQRHIKPQLFTDWHFSYQPQANHKVFLHVNNILDRRDIVSTGNSNYYTLGRNFMLGYEYLF
ncbi:MAG: TonB-dependent receptor [Phascolarctobacterium sp.]|nr:TonB-dependent receptor [Phascolarctobacterium sp.]